jgi:hypothetical protein
MSNPADPAALQALIEDMTRLIRRAFADGYRHGTNEAIDRMTRAASFGADGRLPALVGSASPQDRQAPAPDRMSPPRVGLPSSRAYKYGSVIGLFRQALIAARGVGLTRENFVDFCAQRGTEVTVYQCKDVIKRLIGNEEAERDQGLIYAGRRLQPYVEPADMNGTRRPPPAEGEVTTDVR